MNTDAPGPLPQPNADDVRWLRDYIAMTERLGNTLECDLPLVVREETAPTGDATLRRRVLDRVPEERRAAVRYQIQLRYTAAIRRREADRAEMLARRKPLLLHLGSGFQRKEGWVNVDIAGHPVDLRWDLSQPLPFAPGSVDGIFHEHVLEHFPLPVGLAFLDANYRLLRTDGVIRVVVPDAGAYLKSYADGGSGLIDEVRRGRPTSMAAINELFYLYTHVAMYDAETLNLFLAAAGFRNIEVRTMGSSRFDPCPDSEHRRSESLYVEALK